MKAMPPVGQRPPVQDLARFAIGFRAWATHLRFTSGNVPSDMCPSGHACSSAKCIRSLASIISAFVRCESHMTTSCSAHSDVSAPPGPQQLMYMVCVPGSPAGLRSPAGIPSTMKLLGASDVSLPHMTSQSVCVHE
eukprot:2103697-Rhodomonas_salina.1